MHFLNINLPEETNQLLLPEKELRELPDHNPAILKRSNIDFYMEIPNATFSNGRYSALNDFCHTEILAYITCKKKSNKTCKY